MKNINLLLWMLLFSVFGISQELSKEQLSNMSISADLNWSRYVSDDRDSLYLLGKKLCLLGMDNNHSYCLAIGKTYVASYFLRSGKAKTAREIYKPLILYFKERNDLKHEVEVINEIGNTYLIDGFPTEAIPYFKECLKLAEDNRDVQIRELSRINLAKAYLKLKKYDLAEKEILNYCKNLENTEFYQSRSNAFSVLSSYYLSMSKDSLAILALQESLNLAIKSNSKSAIANAYNNWGVREAEKSNIEFAFVYFKKAEDCYHETRNLNGIIEVYFNFGLLYQMKGDFEKARLHFNLSRNFARETSKFDEENDALYAMAMLEKEQGNLLKTNKLLDSIIAIKDTQLEFSKARDLDQLSFAESLDGFEQIAEARRNELKLRNETSQKYVFLLLVIIALLVLVVVSSLLKNRSNKTIPDV